MNVILPIVLPLAGAVLGFTAWGSLRVQRWLGVLASAGQLAAGGSLLVTVHTTGPQVLHLGGWPPPYAITLVADSLGALMVAVTGLVGLATTVYALAEVPRDRQERFFFPLLLVLLTGVSGAFLTGDIFNLYVCFEIMLIASFVLLALGGQRQQMEGALKYVTLNLLSSALFLAAVGLVYGTLGTLSFADLARRAPDFAVAQPALSAAIAGLFLVSFSIKAAVFPLGFWLPASYHTPSVAVSAVFAGLLTKVGIYALVRVATLVFPATHSVWRLLLWGAALSMLAGALGAVSQFHVRRILGFHIISQIGYMVMGLAMIVSPDDAVRRLGLMATVFYLVHHIVVKTNLYLLGGVIRRLGGSEELGAVGGLMTRAPVVALLFVIPAASLAGIPPLSGFWAKLGILKAGLAGGWWWLVAAAVVAGLLTLMSMHKIWNEAFWKSAPNGAEATAGRPVAMLAPVAVLAAVTLVIGLWPQPLLEVATVAADQLLDPESYVAAVGLVP